MNLRQNVFSWANWMTLKAAGKEVAQAEATYQAAEQQLILRVAQAYFNVLAAEDGLEANQASLDAISHQLDQANKRFEVGLIAITDVEDAKAARDTAAAAVIAAKRTLATSEDQLQEITGQKYDSLAKPGDEHATEEPRARRPEPLGRHLARAESVAHLQPPGGGDRPRQRARRDRRSSADARPGRRALLPAAERGRDPRRVCPSPTSTAISTTGRSGCKLTRAAVFSGG